MNHNLYNYGIQNEASDIRVHVCPTVKRVYVYPTTCGLSAIETGQYPLKNGYQEGVRGATAQGYLVPPFDIEKCIALTFRPVAWQVANFQKCDTTSEKGQKAVRLVKAMLKNGLFPVPFLGREITDRDLQISGTDIIVHLNETLGGTLHLQVKCDYEGGERELGGTGNLFLQVAECNPLRHY